MYEAGFCGFWIHERLTALGIDNIVVNPADVPTKSSEKLRKSDAVDSGKLARSLRANELKGIYTPDSVSLKCVHDKIEELDHQRHDPSEPDQVPVTVFRHQIPQEFPRTFSKLIKNAFSHG